MKQNEYNPLFDWTFWKVGIQVGILTGVLLVLIFGLIFGGLWVHDYCCPPLKQGTVIGMDHSPPRWMGKSGGPERWLVEIESLDHLKTRVVSVSEWDYLHTTNGQYLEFK